jgi:TRAP-type uncharacterized transport system substrate-binding protein
MTMTYRLKLVTALIAGVLALAGSAQAQEMKFFRIGTGSAGGTYFPIGGLIANAMPTTSPPSTRARWKPA